MEVVLYWYKLPMEPLLTPLRLALGYPRIRSAGWYLRHLDSVLLLEEWVQTDGSPAQYDQVQLTFLQHQVDVGEYPRHMIVVSVYNGSDFGMQDVSLFGVILDGDGDPVDIVYSGFSDEVELIPSAAQQLWLPRPLPGPAGA